MLSLRTRLFSAAFLLGTTTAIAQMGAQTSPAAVSPSLKIQNGAQSLTLSTQDFQPLPHVTVTVRNPHSNADETYSGVPLIDLLAKVGVPQGKALRGKALASYILATGSDGYQVVLSVAEVDPALHPGEIIVADSMDSKPLDSKLGPFRLVVPEDKRPARSVHNLVSLDVKQAD
jgi:hypothetical protein